MAWIRAFTSTEVSSAYVNPGPLVTYPAHETNDVLLLALAMDGTNLPDLPSGYTNILTINGAAQRFRLCYKVAASAAEVCPTLNVSAADEWHIVVIAVAGADYDDPINFNASRTTTDAAAPFTWTSAASTDETNVLIFHFCNSDTGLALTALPPFVNLVNGDVGSAGQGCAYTFQPASGSIVDCTWTGRANDDTTACAVGINDDGNGTRPAYAGASTVGSYISALGGTSLIESDTNPTSLAVGALCQRVFSQVWTFDGTSTYTPETTDMTSAATADVPMTNANNAALYLGYDYTFGSVCLLVSTAQNGANFVWEYYTGSAWATLTVSGVLTATGWVRLSWTIPSDMSTASIGSVTKYYVRFRQTGIITATPTFSQGFVGGRPTTYDAIANVGDAGINPFNDVISLSPAQTGNLSGSPRLFGSSKDMDTGLLVVHHRAPLARDYAVDVCANDLTYPVTIIDQGLGGLVVVLFDVDTDYEVYSIHGKGALSASNNDYNVAVIGINNDAQAWGVFGSLNRSAITRMEFLNQGVWGAMAGYFSTLLMVQTIVVVGGSSGVPITAASLKWVATHSIGVNLLWQGIGTYSRIYAPMQIGGDAQTVAIIDGETFAMPTAFDGKTYFDWNAGDNVAGWTFYGTSIFDKIKFTNCIFIGAQPYRWEFHASHSANAELDFNGTKVQGATVTLRAAVTLVGVTFKSCPTFTLNGAGLSSCAFIDTKVSASSPEDADDISGSTFTKTTGTQHALEITGTVADMTLDGVTFTGYASSDGSTGNEAVYVNIATGSMTIYVTGGGTMPSVRTAGATVTKVQSVALTVRVKDAVTLANIENARVFLETSPGGTDLMNELTTSGGIAEETYNYTGDQAVSGRVRKASASPLYKTGDITGTITSAGLDVTVLLIRDE